MRNHDMELAAAAARQMNATLLTLQAMAGFVRDSRSSRTRDGDALAADLQAAGRGDAASLEALYGATARSVLALVRRIAGDSGAEDIMLACYLQVWQQARRFDASRGTAISWLLAIARNVALEHARTAGAAHADADADASAPAQEDVVAHR
jgi:RNA polymerase sigma-70 factor (ECF subfamily)